MKVVDPKMMLLRSSADAMRNAFGGWMVAVSDLDGLLSRMVIFGVDSSDRALLTFGLN